MLLNLNETVIVNYLTSTLNYSLSMIAKMVDVPGSNLIYFGVSFYELKHNDRNCIVNNAFHWSIVSVALKSN